MNLAALRFPLWHSGHLANASQLRLLQGITAQKPACPTHPLGRLVFVLKDRDVSRIKYGFPSRKTYVLLL